MHNKNVHIRLAVMETAGVSLGWNYAFYVEMGEFLRQNEEQNTINGTGRAVAKHLCWFLVIIAFLAQSNCFSFWSFQKIFNKYVL